MHLTFKETKEEVYAAQRVSKHVSPHLHNALEIVCVTEGTLEMGVGQELYLSLIHISEPTRPY